MADTPDVLADPPLAQIEIEALKAELAGTAPGSTEEAEKVERLNEIVAILGLPYSRTAEDWRTTEGW